MIAQDATNEYSEVYHR